MRKNSIVKRAHHKLNKRIKRKRDSFEIEGYQFGSTNQSKLLFWVLFSPFWWWFMPKCIRKLNKKQQAQCLGKVVLPWKNYRLLWLLEMKIHFTANFWQLFLWKVCICKDTLEIKFKELFSPTFLKHGQKIHIQIPKSKHFLFKDNFQIFFRLMYLADWCEMEKLKGRDCWLRDDDL